MSIPFKKDPIEFNQSILFPVNIFDLLPGDHESHIYEVLFKQLNTTSIEKKYSVLGQNAYHPRLILGILIYAYSNGVFSSRQIKSYGRLKEREKELTEEIEALVRKAERCDSEEDAEYKDKTGYEIPEELKIKEKRLAKIKAAKEALEQREQEQTPGKEIDDKKQISFADKEARIMGKTGDFKYAYNGQITVDKDNQIIVGQHITQNANDKQEVKPALQEIRDTTGELPDVMSLDNDYMSGDNLEELNKTDIDVYIATGKGEISEDKSPADSERGIKKSQFTYDTENDCFVCPSGHTLELKSSAGDGKKTYQAQSADCDCCPCRCKCCTSKKGEPRTITSDMPTTAGWTKANALR